MNFALSIIQRLVDHYEVETELVGTYNNDQVVRVRAYGHFWDYYSSEKWGRDNWQERGEGTETLFRDILKAKASGGVIQVIGEEVQFKERDASFGFREALCPYCDENFTHIMEVHIIQDVGDGEAKQLFTFEPERATHDGYLGSVAPSKPEPGQLQTGRRGGGVDIERGCEGCGRMWVDRLHFHKGVCDEARELLPGSLYPHLDLIEPEAVPVDPDIVQPTLDLNNLEMGEA